MLLLSKEMDALKLRGGNINDVSWSELEIQLAKQLRVERECIIAARKEFFLTGEILEPVNKKPRGQASSKYKKQILLNRLQLCDLVNEVDKQHAAGRTVTNHKMRNYVRYTHQMIISRSTMGRYFKSLGLSWKPVQANKKTASAYRMDLLYDFIIKFDDYYNKVFYSNQIESDYVFVFTDESYIHKGHGKKMTYTREGGPDVNRKTSKGDRLIIMHAITHEKPLASLDANGRPIEITEWNQDTPHPESRDDEDLFTCETLWKASSSTGDYHDNMNSDMFMLWVEQKLIPTFNDLYKNKKMILVMDNAAYHHKREVGSFSSKTKDEIVDDCIKYKVQYIDVPPTTNRYKHLNKPKVVMNNVMINPDGTFRVTFDEDLFQRNNGK